MREILFRGKTENGKWLEGYLHKIDGVGKGYTAYAIQIQDINTRFCRPHSHEVISETIGQFTGLTDKNGKKIFEDDIVRIKYEETTIEKAVIEYSGFGFYGATIGDYWELENYYEIEVIGNRWDNPKLLGEQYGK